MNNPYSQTLDILPQDGPHASDDMLLYAGQCDCSATAERTGTLSAWLHITNRCNLHCAYCYQQHTPADMSAAVGRAAVDAAFRSAAAHGYQRVKLKYSGGEALLRFSLVTNLHRYARSVARQHNLALNGVILSNGTLLTPGMANEIRALGLHLVISLDGIGSGPNQQRCYANGRGSALDVTRAIECALACGLLPGISITVSGRNASDLPELIGWILERDLPFNINFYREHASSSQSSDLALEEQHIIRAMLDAYRVIEMRLPRRSLLASLVDGANLAVPHQYPCGVGKSYMVFDYRGQVSKCQMQMDRPITNADATDPLARLRADSTGIQNLPVSAKEACHACAWKLWCAGGCPLTTHRTTGRYDTRSPNCAIYKALYPEVVRLEKLRRLRYGSAAHNVGETTSEI